MTTKKKKLRPLVKPPKGGRFSLKKIRDALKAVEKEKANLKVGDTIYIGTTMYIDHGQDDVRGGKATVSKIVVEPYATFIEVKEVPGHGWNLDILLENQSKWKKEFGNDRAYPDPDYGSTLPDYPYDEGW